MQLELNFHDGHESLEDQLARLHELDQGLFGSAAKQIERLLVGGNFTLAEHFFPHEYEAMLCYWGHARLGLDIVMMTGSLDSSQEDEDGNLPTERIAAVMLAEPFTHQKSLRKHTVLSPDPQVETVQDWIYVNEYLPGVCGYIETSHCDKYDLEDIEHDGVFTGERALLYVDILLAQLVPAWLNNAVRISRQVALGIEVLASDGGVKHFPKADRPCSISRLPDDIFAVCAHEISIGA